MTRLGIVLALVGALLAACGDTGPSGSTNVQGGGSRAPQPGQPGGQATARPTSTAAR
jgi:hypothetical protein